MQVLGLAQQQCISLTHKQVSGGQVYGWRAQDASKRSSSSSVAAQSAIIRIRGLLYEPQLTMLFLLWMFHLGNYSKTQWYSSLNKKQAHHEHITRVM